MALYAARTDDELVTLLQGGDRAAFTAIYDRYFNLIYYQVNQLLRDPEAAKDILQEIFMTIWDRPELLDGKNNLAGYLYVAGRNKVFKLIEKGRVRSDYVAAFAKYASEADTATLEEIDERALQQTIAQLPPKMREVFELSRKDNLSHQEIADKLGISDQPVKKQISNAIKILKPKLNAVAPYGTIILALLKKPWSCRNGRLGKGL